MKLRTQLLVAFLLLSVLPLTAISLYSYRSSIGALHRTIEEESGRLAQAMERRMESLTAELSRRIEGLKDLPDEALPQAGRPVFLTRMVQELGDSAKLVESVRITPLVQRIAADAASAEETARGFLVRLGQAAGPEVARGLEIVAQEIERREVSQEELERWLVEVGGAVGRELRAGVPPPKSSLPPPPPPSAPEPAAIAFTVPLACDLERQGESLVRLEAQVNTEQLLREVLGFAQREQGEIPFAVDGKGIVHTLTAADRRTLDDLYVATLPVGVSIQREAGGKPWVLTARKDEVSGLRFGLAHPVGKNLGEIRRAAVRNLTFGLGAVLVALLGILPLSSRMTRNLDEVAAQAERIAGGDLAARVPVRSQDEFGRLARSFNRMAEDLERDRERLVEQERLRKELEMCRRIQNELLPRGPLHHPFAEALGLSIPARELGGDFFNYFPLPSGEVVLLMGDVSGKGVPAALLMANVQATLRARLPLEPDLALFMGALDGDVAARTPEAVYLTLFIGVLDPKRRELRYVNGGHPAPFLLRRGGALDRLDPTGRPVGLLTGGGFEERRIDVGAGDLLFLYTDGLVEADNVAGESFGQARLEALLAGIESHEPAAVVRAVEGAFLRYRGGRDAPDDATLLVLRVEASG